MVFVSFRLKICNAQAYLHLHALECGQRVGSRHGNVRSLYVSSVFESGSMQVCVCVGVFLVLCWLTNTVVLFSVVVCSGYCRCRCPSLLGLALHRHYAMRFFFFPTMDTSTAEECYTAHSKDGVSESAQQ